MYFQRMKKAFLNLSLTSKLKYIYTALIFLCISCNLLILYGFFFQGDVKSSLHTHLPDGGDRVAERGQFPLRDLQNIHLFAWNFRSSELSPGRKPIRPCHPLQTAAQFSLPDHGVHAPRLLDSCHAAFRRIRGSGALCSSLHRNGLPRRCPLV